MSHDPEPVLLRTYPSQGRECLQGSEAEVEYPVFRWSSTGESDQENSASWGVHFESDLGAYPGSDHTVGYDKSGTWRPGTPVPTSINSQGIGFECIREWDRLFQRKETENHKLKSQSFEATVHPGGEGADCESEEEEDREFEETQSEDGEDASSCSTIFSLDESDDETESFRIIEE